MRTRIAVLFAVALSAAAIPALTGALAQPGPGQGGSPHEPAGGPGEACRDMGRMRDDMIANMKAADERLAELAGKMNHAADQAGTLAAIKDLLNELVGQRKAMQEGMTRMQQSLMPHALGHVTQGMDDAGRQRVMDSMRGCPMMHGSGATMGPGEGHAPPPPAGTAPDQPGGHHPK